MATPKKKPEDLLKRGRKAKVLTPEQLKELEKFAGVMTLDQLADYFGIGDRTLRNKLINDPAINAIYKKGRQTTLKYVTSKLLQLVSEGNPGAIYFYLKTQGGYKETQIIEVPQDITFSIDFNNELEKE